ncbi:hypothetical protein A5791_18270 [Mycobacterium sp. 852002-51163_SCH5372311]|uniref:hypothetical protein n=1 Tax=Mycobacterium sp. 852002-51163_SCH5372311 TaxID=1834097 RepID=UPI0007FC15D1|nr:hypothetical protein [Mycobacterium sp. 852002-51163_SCH5372311]OBF87878.1 hypothetical protein A5791_18270 [Mycobacterium sp. 852002-51163_SCH5372311]
MTEPQLLLTDLIERYVRRRGRRYFSGQHDGEYFFIADALPRRLYVHLGVSRWHSDVFTIRIAPAYFFPAAEDARLAQLTDAWNQQNPELMAVVHASSDPQRVGVYVTSSRRIRNSIPFEDFASFVNQTIAAGTELFGELAVLTDLPSTQLSLLRQAG